MEFSVFLPSLPDLDIVEACLAILFDIDVDWEMGIDVSHFVFVAFSDTDYEVVDESLNSSESCDILAGAVVDFDRDFFLRGQGKADCEVGKVFGQFS
jgi:hypothetical protein